MVLSIVVGLQQVVLPDATEQVRLTLQRVEDLQKDIERKLQEVRRLKAGLEAARARAEEQQQDPIASRLAEVLENVHGTKKAAETTFSFTCEACAPSTLTNATSVRRVAEAFRELGHSIDAPEILIGPLGSMDDEHFDALDRCLVDLRSSHDRTDSDMPGLV